jgi:NAD-dependent protein deacetylases, SIR2 family
MNEDESVALLQQWVDESKQIVFFGGAGVSTESGIPDFRSQDGLYHQKYKFPPEQILSHTFFLHHPEEFYRFYREKMLCLTAQPNDAHKKLAELEQKGKQIAVVTQNIDGLHQKAGSRMVFELHGSVLRNSCLQCGKKYGAETIRDSAGLPRCSCGGLIKPDVVLYEEGLDEETVAGAVEAIASAQLMIVAGTSLTVYPAAGLIRYFGGKHLVQINRTATALDGNADLAIRGSVGETLRQIHAGGTAFGGEKQTSENV